MKRISIVLICLTVWLTACTGAMKNTNTTTAGGQTTLVYTGTTPSEPVTDISASTSGSAMASSIENTAETSAAISSTGMSAGTTNKGGSSSVSTTVKATVKSTVSTTKKPSATSVPVTAATKPATTLAPVTTTTKPATTLAPVTTTTRPATTLAPVTTTMKPATTLAPITTLAPTTTTAPATQPATTEPSTAVTPIITEKINAVWICSRDYDEGLLKGKTEDQFRTNMEKVFANCVSIGVNTAIVAVHPYGDAIYQSDLFAWSSSVTGTFGAAPGFDPLKIIIQEAKKKGIDIHAWFNPYRLMKEKEILLLDDTSVIKRLYNNRENNDYIRLIDGRWYLNPASAEAQKLILDGIAEILRKYDVQGIHIDDYFYPTTALSYDNYSYAQSGTAMSRGDWRRNNVTTLVANIYKTIKDINGSAVFGISPAAGIGHNHDNLYADVELWTSKPGYMDYFCPQIYYGFESQEAPFVQMADLANSMIKTGKIRLVIGLASYKIGTVDAGAGSGSREWIDHDDIIPRQIAYAKTLSDYSGVAFFRYGSMFSNVDGSYINIAKSQTTAIKSALN